MVDLKNCPFCGGKAELSVRGMTAVSRATDLKYYAVVNCPSCEASVCGEATDDEDEAQPLAIAAWNRRALQAVGPEPAVALKPLVAQIDALLALENPVPAIPHLARSLLASARSALVATPPAEQHPDDIAVDRFAASMKEKLKWEREHRNRSGWQTMSAADLSRLLYEHLPKGDPVDVANLSMMLHQNGQQIETPPAEPVVEAAQPAETYYTKGKDAEYFEKLSDKDFAWALTCASQDLNDSDENVSQWMPVTALLSDAADRISALTTKPAVKDDETVVEALREALKFVNEASGVALGIAVSGSGHPNPDGVLMDLSRKGMGIASRISAALATKPAVKDDETVVEALHPYENFNAAIDFAINEGLEAETFLRVWREGDWQTLDNEWPEWKAKIAALAAKEGRS